VNDLSFGVITVEEARRIVNGEAVMNIFGGGAVSQFSENIETAIKSAPIPFGMLDRLEGFDIRLRASLNDRYEDIELKLFVVPVYKEKK